MSMLALALSVFGVAASLAVALWAWHAMTHLDDDPRTYASFELMRLDIAPVAIASVTPLPPASAGRGHHHDHR
jgi:hypothetical protein